MVSEVVLYSSFSMPSALRVSPLVALCCSSLVLCLTRACLPATASSLAVASLLCFPLPFCGLTQEGFLVPSVAEEHRVALRSARPPGQHRGGVRVVQWIGARPCANFTDPEFFNGYDYKLCPVCIGQGIVERMIVQIVDIAVP